MEGWGGWIYRYRGVLLYLLTAFVVASIAAALDDFDNYRAFAAAAHDLAAGKILYERNNAYFLYSPVFAFAFWTFAWMPVQVGMFAWCLVNFGVAGLALHHLLPDDVRMRGMLVALAGIILVTPSDQSNLLIAGLMIVAAMLYWRGRLALAAVAVVAAGLIKLFPFAAGIWALKSGSPVRAVAWLVLVLAVALALPLLVTPPETLLAQYGVWKEVTLRDYAWRGWSMSNMLRGLGLDLPVQPVELACLALGVAPILFCAQRFSDRQRRLAVALLFITLVLANHRSETQSYVIAGLGLGIWYASGPASWPRLAFALLTVLATGPFFPAPGGIPGDWHTFIAVRRPYFPARMFGYVALWLLLQWQLWRREAPQPLPTG